MTKFLLAGIGALALVAAQPAVAADMPVKAPIVKAPIVDSWSWNNFYVGLNGGYSWGHSSTDWSFWNATTGALLASGTDKLNLNGGVFGGQIGKNWQSNNWVFGLEADIQWSGEKDDTRYSCPTPAGSGPCNLVTAGPPGAGVSPNTTFNQKIEWFGTVRARLGTTVTPTTLAYVTGGLAYGGLNMNGVISGFTAANVPTSVAWDHDFTKAGWVVGGGLEGRLTGNWTGKIEALYMDFGRSSGTVTLPNNPPPLRFDYSAHITDFVLRVGVNYQFGSPVVARY